MRARPYSMNRTSVKLCKVDLFDTRMTLYRGTIHLIKVYQLIYSFIHSFPLIVATCYHQCARLLRFIPAAL